MDTFKERIHAPLNTTPQGTCKDVNQQWTLTLHRRFEGSRSLSFLNADLRGCIIFCVCVCEWGFFSTLCYHNRHLATLKKRALKVSQCWVNQGKGSRLGPVPHRLCFVIVHVIFDPVFVLIRLIVDVQHLERNSENFTASWGGIILFLSAGEK